MTRQRGFSLLELIVSLFAASLLMMLIMQQYLVSKREYVQMRMLLQQNIEIQLVSDLIRNSLRKSGFTPCAGLSSLQTIDSRRGRTGLVAVEAKARDEILRINRMDE